MMMKVIVQSDLLDDQLFKQEYQYLLRLFLHLFHQQRKSDFRVCSGY